MHCSAAPCRATLAIDILSRPYRHIICEQSDLTARTGINDIVDKDEEEGGAENTSLWYPSSDCASRRGHTLAADTNGAVAEEGSEPPP